MNKLFEPIPDLLRRDIENEIVINRLSYFADALDKLVSIGTHLITWELQDVKDPEIGDDEAIIVSVMFKRIIEIIDSISVQLKQGVVSPAATQLRVLFEICIQFEHLLAKDTYNKCLSILICDWHKPLLQNIPIDEQHNDYEEYINGLKLLIDKPKLLSFKNEYTRLNKHKNKQIKWYNLFNDKLSDFSKLVLHEFKQYKVEYRFISKEFGNDAIHSTNLLLGNFVLSEDGLPAVSQMRINEEPVINLEPLALAGITFKIARNCFEAFNKRQNSHRQRDFIAAILDCEKAHMDVAFPSYANYLLKKRNI